MATRASLRRQQQAAARFTGGTWSSAAQNEHIQKGRMEKKYLSLLLSALLCGCPENDDSLSSTEEEGEDAAVEQSADDGGVADDDAEADSESEESADDEQENVDEEVVSAENTEDLVAILAEDLANGGTSAERGGLQILVVDAPAEVDEVWVTFCEIAVRRNHDGSTAEETDSDGSEEEADDEVSEESADNGTDEVEQSGEEEDLSGDADDVDEQVGALSATETWLEFPNECYELDLLELQDGVSASLGLGVLPSGTYSEIRLRLVDAHVVVGEEEHDLKVPSGAQSGLKIKGSFAVGEGLLTTVTLDFDAEKSVHVTGNGKYMLQPVISLISVESEVLVDVDEGAEEEDDEVVEEEGDVETVDEEETVGDGSSDADSAAAEDGGADDGADDGEDDATAVEDDGESASTEEEEDADDGESEADAAALQ